MATDEKTRGNSTTTGGRYYYPTVDELVNADGEGFKHLTEKLTKERLLGLLKDTIGHLRQAKLSILFLKLMTKSTTREMKLWPKLMIQKMELGIKREIKSCPGTRNSI